jgi:hypothetical protein
VPQEFSNDNITQVAARLPGLDIEITHDRLPDSECISIHLKATPSFEAFGRFFEATNPFTFWAQAMQMAWMPWLNATQVLPSAVATAETQRKLPQP